MKKKFHLELTERQMRECIVENCDGSQFLFLKVWDEERNRYLLPVRIRRDSA